MNFVVLRNKLGFSFIIFAAAFLFITSLAVGGIVSSASSHFQQHNPDQTENTGNSKANAQNPSHPQGSGRMTLQRVADSSNHSVDDAAVSPIFDEFNNWVEERQSENFAANDAQLETGVKLAIERERALKQLMTTNPRLAIEQSIAPETRKRLPREIAAHTEKPVSAYGDLMVYVVEGFDRENERMSHARVERFVVINDKRYEAFVYGRRETMTTKLNIPIRGIIVGDRIALDESPARRIESGVDFKAGGQAGGKSGDETVRAEIGGEVVSLSSEAELNALVNEQIEWEAKIGPARPANTNKSENALASSWTEGSKTVLVIRVDTSDRPGEPTDHYNNPLTLARAQGLFTNSVAPFYANSSYNKTSLTATVTPVVRLPQTQSYYAMGSNYNVMLSDARNAARNAGFDTNLYSLDIITFSYTPSIGWAGIAAVGGKANMLNGAFYLPETAHELGHNYGLMHANFWRTTDGTPNGAGSNVEYGDCYDNMGACYNGDLSRHFNVRYKHQLNWLTDADVQTVAGNGTYRIYAQDSSQKNGIHALKIKGTTKNYWLEFRQLMSGNARNGALIRWENSQGYPETQLLDMNPSTAWNRFPSDEPLAVGQSYYDSVNQIKITVVGKGGTSPESLDVQVELNSGGGTTTPTCSYAITPGSQSFTSTGGSGSINVTTQSGCAWTAVSNQSFASVTSGASGSGNGTVNYTVAANTTTSARSATLTIAGQSFTVQQEAAVSGTYTLVANPGAVAVGATVSVNFTAPAGSSYYDWVGLFKVGAPNSSYLDFGYTTGGTAGTFNVTTPTEAGQYEFRYMLNNGFTSVATSNTVSVQSVSCSYAISSNNQNFSGAGGTGAVSVTTGTGCSWTASGNPSWITITGGASGSGSGTVSFTVQPNSGIYVRSATMTVAGQTVTINQEAAAASLFDISGAVIYGTTPVGQSAKYVTGVSFNGASASALSVVSDGSGNYQLSGLTSGNYTITAAKSGDVNSINSFDISRVQQYLVGLTTLTPNQLLAADVDGSGVVTSLDASRLQQYLVGISSNNNIGRWRFVPATRQYNALSSSLSNENYEAVLIGEVSGNWSPTATSMFAETETEFTSVENNQSHEFIANNDTNGGFENELAGQISARMKQSADSQSAQMGEIVTVSLPSNATASAGNTIVVPVSVGEIPTGTSVESFDFSVYYDATVLQPATPAGSGAGTLSASCSTLVNSPSAGRVIVSGACGGSPIITGSGTLYNLTFTVIGTANQTSGLSFVNPADSTNTFVFNNSSPSAATTNGEFTVLGPTAANLIVAGRVTNSLGRGVANVLITMTDSAGNQRQAQTTSFGYYRFESVTAGETVTLTAKARRYRFNQSSIVRTTNQSVSDGDFIAEN